MAQTQALAADPPSWFASLPPVRRAVIALLALLVAVLPILAVQHLPLVDYPNHLGRFQIYVDLPNSPSLQAFYQWQWGIIPNLAVDILVIPFTWFLPVEPAANTVILLSFIVTMAGTMFLDRQLNGPAWGLSVFTGLVLYSGAFRYGFVNYTVTVGFAVFAFGLWVRWRDRVLGPGFIGFVALGVFLLIMHMFGLGLYAVCVGGYELTVLWQRWRAEGRLRVAQFRLPVAAALSLLLPMSLLLFSPASDAAGVFRWSTLQWKLEALLSPFLFNQPTVELPLVAVLGLTIGFGLWAGVLRVHARMVLPLAILALLFLAIPRTLFNSNYADFRLLCGVTFFALASLRLQPASGARGRLILGILTACLLVRTGSLLANWLPAQPILAEYDHALDQVPPGAKVLALMGRPGTTSANRSPPLEHIAVFIGARRGALVPYLFTHEATPIRLRPDYQSYWHFDPRPENAADMARYDYVLTIRDPQFTTPPGLKLDRVGQGATYTLFRVIRPSSG